MWPASTCFVLNSKERRESLLVLFHPLPCVPPTQLLTRYPDLLVQTVLQILFPDVLDMVSAGCSPLISVRPLFNMHFTNIDVLGGVSQLELTGLNKHVFWSTGAIALQRLPPQERGIKTVSADLLPQVDSHCKISKVFF